MRPPIKTCTSSPSHLHNVKEESVEELLRQPFAFLAKVTLKKEIRTTSKYDLSGQAGSGKQFSADGIVCRLKSEPTRVCMTCLLFLELNMKKTPVLSVGSHGIVQRVSDIT